MFQPFQSDVPLDSSCEVPTRQQQQRTSGKRQRCFQPLQSQLDSLHPKRADAAVEADTTFLPELNHSAGVGPLNPRKLASLLWADKSEHAICIGDWDQLLQCCDVALSTAADAFAQRTAEADVRHWKIWSEYCEIMGTDPFRPQVDPVMDRVAFLREIVLLVNALMHFMKTRKPRSNSSQVIQPQSAMNILLGANRVLRANFASFVPLRNLKLPLKGLMRRFVQRFGPQSLVPTGALH